MLEISSKSETETGAIGEDLAATAMAGMVVCLSGELGAGKSVLARAMIRAICQDGDLEVPSPTYTLCHSYEGRVPVAHFDLYRLSDPQETEELGIDEAASRGVVIVEWPQNAGDNLPDASLNIRIEGEDCARTMTITGQEVWLDKLRRSNLVRQFLASHIGERFHRQPMPADASSRRYEVIATGSERNLLMDAPAIPGGPTGNDARPYSELAHIAEEVLPFVAVGKLLKSKGFSAPIIRAFDLEEGLVLIEHLGEGVIVDEAGAAVADRYLAAAECLVKLHQAAWPGECAAGNRVHPIPRYDLGAVLAEAELLLDWYVPDTAGRPATEAERRAFREIWAEYHKVLEASQQSLVLRDYHSPNIIWRPELDGTDRIGLIDFQDAVIGPAAYDLASLAQDARTDISQGLESSIIAHYLEMRAEGDPEFDAPAFAAATAIMAAQRNSKILGIFVRLDLRDGKSEYRRHLPRVREYLKRNLAHPALSAYAEWLGSVIEL